MRISSDRLCRALVHGRGYVLGYRENGQGHKNSPQFPEGASSNMGWNFMPFHALVTYSYVQRPCQLSFPLLFHANWWHFHRPLHWSAISTLPESVQYTGNIPVLRFVYEHRSHHPSSMHRRGRLQTIFAQRLYHTCILWPQFSADREGLGLRIRSWYTRDTNHGAYNESAILQRTDIQKSIESWHEGMLPTYTRPEDVLRRLNQNAWHCPNPSPLKISLWCSKPTW